MATNAARHAVSSILCAAFSLGALSALAQPAAPAAEEPKPRHFVRVPAPSGVHIRRYNKTDGEMPTQKSRVIIHYHGTLEDGSVFDSSVKRGGPENMSLDKVILCWQEGLTRLRVGEKAQLRCPPATAYGLKGQPPKIPPNATLTFEVEILAIQ